MRIDASFAETLLTDALKLGAQQAEVFLGASSSLSVEVKKGEVDSLKSARGFGYSLRIIKDGRLGFSFSNDMGERRKTAERAVESAAHTDRDEFLGLPEPGVAPHVEMFDPAVSDISEDKAISSVRLLEESVFREDSRISKIRKASGSFSSSEVLIMNSLSVAAGYRGTSCSAQVTAIASEGNENQTGWEFGAGRRLADISFGEIGRKAARNAVRLLGARKLSGRKADIMLDGSVVVDFLGIFASSLSSESVQKGRSLLSGKTGRTVVSPKVSFVDSGLLPWGLGSSPVDDEGVPVREKHLVRSGVLEGYLYNTYTAKKGGTTTTGNASRGGFASLPSVGVTNLYLESASADYLVSSDSLFSSLGTGLYVVDAMGVHTANPVSGDFSIGVTGLWIENGSVAYPVKETVISGNVLDLFMRIEAVGDDRRFYGSVGAPSLIISGIDISG